MTQARDTQTDDKCVAECYADEMPNAYLVAAAPKLLAENRRLREALRSCGELASCAPHDNKDLANQEFTKIMRIARAALADTEVQS